MDFYMRDLFTQIGGIDQCVSEFIRVTDQTLPDKIFFRDVPELTTKCKTRSGAPVFVQLLGGDELRMAEHARIAVDLGAVGVDLNFGCPAKTVNRHDGGATLLLYPQRIEKLVTAVRKAVPSHLPVTAKIRLGFTDPQTCFENAKAVENGGADWLTIHCRTKTQMYQPPVDWKMVQKVRAVVKLPLIANGDIFSVEDFGRCQNESGSEQFMVGRGLLRDPFLVAKIRGLECDSSWPAVLSLIESFKAITASEVSPAFAKARTKQWLREMAKGPYPEAKTLFDTYKLS